MFGKLYLKFVLCIFGKKPINPQEAADIAVDMLSPGIGIGGKPIPKLPGLTHSDTFRLDVEFNAALVFLFAHLFEQSCGDRDFAAQALSHYGSRIAFLSAKDEASYEQITRIFQERGSEYLKILTASPHGDLSAFSIAHAKNLGLPHQAAQSCETFTQCAITYRAMISRLWDTMKIKK